MQPSLLVLALIRNTETETDPCTVQSEGDNLSLTDTLSLGSVSVAGQEISTKTVRRGKTGGEGGREGGIIF